VSSLADPASRPNWQAQHPGEVPKTIRTNQMTQRGASPRAAATAFGLGQHHLRRLIREGAVTPRAVGRRSIVLFSELEAALRALPPTKSSKRDEARHAA